MISGETPLGFRDMRRGPDGFPTGKRLRKGAPLAALIIRLRLPGEAADKGRGGSFFREWLRNPSIRAYNTF